MTSKRSDRILVLGMGSEALMDDGIPVHLIRDLKASVSDPHFTFLTSAVGGIELLTLLEGYDMAVIIDTIKTPGGKPGDLNHFTKDNFRETFNLSSNHDLSFRQALTFAGRLEMTMPVKIEILAIEIAENHVLSHELSEPMQRRYPEILSEVRTFIKNMES
jgi:hydrogenase maturation protease